MKKPQGNATHRMLDVLVLGCTLITIGLMSIGYLHLIEEEEQKHVSQVVQENAIQSVKLIRERLSNDMEYIEEVGRYLGEHDQPFTAAETLRMMQSHDRIAESFECVTTATADGLLYGADGRMLGNITNHVHFQSAMAGRTAFSDVEQSLDRHENIICVTAPIKKNGEIIGIINGQYAMSTLDEVLAAESFGGRGHSYMVNAEGQIFACSEHQSGSRDFENLYEKFKKNSTISAAKLEEMHANMRNGGAGWISYEWDGDQRTMNYMPVGINDWYFLSVLPNEIVTSRAVALTQQAFAFSGALMVVLLLLVFYVNMARRKSQKALAAVHEELLTIYNTIPGGVFKCRLDDEFTLVGANDGFYRFIGYSKEEIESKFENRLIRFMQPEDVDCVKVSLAKQLKTGGTTSDEVRFVGADGKTKWLLLSGDVMQSSTGDALIYCCFTDISELKQTQEELRTAKHRYDLITEETQEIIFEWDPVTHTIHHSKIFEKKFGYPCTLENFPQSIVEHHLVPEEDEQKCLDVYRRIEAGSHFSTGEFRIKKADETFLWCRVSVTAVRDGENRLCRAVGVIADIDRVKQELKAVTEKAERDSMTGLYNKTTTEQLIAQRLQTQLPRAALLLVDIDNFKAINDTLGHASGDAALVEVSHQLKALFRATDLVGRIGGDEFMVFIEGLGRGEGLTQKIAAISAVFNWSFLKKDLSYSVSCSIGVALFPQDGSSCEELSKKADAALYFAKQNGKNQFAIYSEEMQASIHGVEDVKSLRREGTFLQ